MDNLYDTYAKTDSQNRITGICADWNGIDVSGMTFIGQQSTAYSLDIYCPLGLYESHGIPQYNLADGVIVERTQAEIDADIAALPAPEPTAEERLAEVESIVLDNTYQIIMLQYGV